MEKIQKTNRVYAVSKGKSIYKVKKDVKYTAKITKTDRWKKNLSKEQVEMALATGYYLADRYDKVANCPPSLIIDNDLKSAKIGDIDKNYYIELAKKRINDFIGGGNEMGRTKKQVENKVNDEKTNVENAIEKVVVPESVFEYDSSKMNDESYKRRKLDEKLYWLQVLFDSQQNMIIKDGYNSNQKYEYAKNKQFKYLLRKNCIKLRLLFKVSEDGNVIPDFSKSQSTSVIGFRSNITLKDIDSGQVEMYQLWTTAGDIADKHSSKAKTQTIKDFVKCEFLINDENDEDDAEATQPVSPEVKEIAKTYYDKNQKESIASDIVAKNNDKKVLDNVVKETTTKAPTPKVEPKNPDAVALSVEYAVRLIKAIRSKNTNNPNEGAKTLEIITKKDANGKYEIDGLSIQRYVIAFENRARALGVDLDAI